MCSKQASHSSWQGKGTRRERCREREGEIPLYLLSIDVLLAVTRLRRFHEPPLDLQIHGGGSALERARHFYVLTLFDGHVGGQVREPTCGWEKERGEAGVIMMRLVCASSTRTESLESPARWWPQQLRYWGTRLTKGAFLFLIREPPPHPPQHHHHHRHI